MMHSAFFHFWVFILVILFSYVNAKRLPSPQFVASSKQRARAVKAVEDYISTIKSDSDRRRGAEPLYQFHPAGVKTYGTVILWHGITDRPSNESLLGRYLFENKFNVFLPPLAGHSLKASRWPFTLIRESKAFNQARNLVLKDKQVMSLIRAINNGTLPPPVLMPIGFDLNTIVKRLFKSFKSNLSNIDYTNIRRAFGLLTSEYYHPGLEKIFFNFFHSDHFRYQSTPLHQLSLVTSLPGPIYVAGFSMGGIQAMYATATSKFIKRQVLLAPFFDINTPKQNPNIRFLFEVAGVLDLYNAPNPLDTNVPSRILPAADIAGRFATQKEITRSVRRHTGTFCVFSPNDNISNFRRGIHICKRRIGNRRSVTFSYPKRNIDIGHFVSPGVLNRFSNSLAKEILRYYVTGKVRRKFLTTVRGDPDLPSLPPLGSPFFINATRFRS